MTRALWRVRDDAGRVRLARGTQDHAEEYLDPDLTIAHLLAADGPTLAEAFGMPTSGRVGAHQVLAPTDVQPIWAAGVTFQRSKVARLAESGNARFYDDVYDADRPELFPKAQPGAAVASGGTVTIRSDSTWDVPEPELVVVADASGAIVALTLGDDVSSRSIEAENPLYLPQAKVWDGSCAIGPCLVALDDAPALADIVMSLEIRRGGETVVEDAVPVSGMKRDVHDLVDWLYRAMSFPQGVMLMTGTSMVPPDEFTLKPGDEISISSPALGSLVTGVALR